MNLDKTALVAIALDCARKAGAYVHKGWRTHPHVEYKGKVDLVTVYDRESEALLKKELAERTPFCVVGEESGGASKSDEPTWYVDPLDGTTNFVHGHPFFCVSVGLVLGGEPILGAVVAPALGTEWTGVVGVGSTRNGESCRVSVSHDFGESLLATGFPADRRTSPDNNFDAFVAIKKKCQAVRRCGSAAIDLCLVGDGTYDGYWEKKLHAWDLAAGAAVVLGAGGKISDYDGGMADVRKGQLLATNAIIHDSLVRELGLAEGARV